MATDSVEKLKKEIASLEARPTELARKTDTATQRHTELESHRPALLTRIEGGDESARRDLRRIDNARLNASEDIQACRIVAADISAKLESAKKGLVRAERDAVTTALANQIDALGALENSVEGALQRLREATREIFASIDGVCGQLELLDRQRWDSRFGYRLRADITEGLREAFEQLGSSASEARREPFIQKIIPRLRGALAQLRYENIEEVKPAPGERLYRTIGSVKGLRDLDLPPGALLGLRPDEAAEFVKMKAIELVDTDQKNVA